MNIFCKLFGHKLWSQVSYKNRPGFGGYEYVKVGQPISDNINRLHSEVTADCARCGENFTVGKCHLPRVDNRYLKHLKKTK